MPLLCKQRSFLTLCNMKIHARVIVKKSSYFTKKIRMTPIIKYDAVNYKIGERNPDCKQYPFGLLTI